MSRTVPFQGLRLPQARPTQTPQIALPQTAQRVNLAGAIRDVQVPSANEHLVAEGMERGVNAAVSGILHGRDLRHQRKLEGIELARMAQQDAMAAEGHDLKMKLGRAELAQLERQALGMPDASEDIDGLGEQELSFNVTPNDQAQEIAQADFEKQYEAAIKKEPDLAVGREAYERGAHEEYERIFAELAAAEATSLPVIDVETGEKKPTAQVVELRQRLEEAKRAKAYEAFKKQLKSEIKENHSRVVTNRVTRHLEMRDLDDAGRRWAERNGIAWDNEYKEYFFNQIATRRPEVWQAATGTDELGQRISAFERNSDATWTFSDDEKTAQAQRKSDIDFVAKERERLRENESVISLIDELRDLASSGELSGGSLTQDVKGKVQRALGTEAGNIQQSFDSLRSYLLTKIAGGETMPRDIARAFESSFASMGQGEDAVIKSLDLLRVAYEMDRASLEAQGLLAGKVRLAEVQRHIGDYYRVNGVDRNGIRMEYNPATGRHVPYTVNPGALAEQVRRRVVAAPMNVADVLANSGRLPRDMPILLTLLDNNTLLVDAYGAEQHARAYQYLGEQRRYQPFSSPGTAVRTDSQSRSGGRRSSTGDSAQDRLIEPMEVDDSVINLKEVDDSVINPKNAAQAATMSGAIVGAGEVVAEGVKRGAAKISGKQRNPKSIWGIVGKELRSPRGLITIYSIADEAVKQETGRGISDRIGEELGEEINYFLYNQEGYPALTIEELERLSVSRGGEKFTEEHIEALRERGFKTERETAEERSRAKSQKRRLHPRPSLTMDPLWTQYPYQYPYQNH